ncbi:MAG: EAL domain-containing protein [Gammaproteobacteria bacterium]|nr:EAL domain-containing protein [Gammaproteobacteria bacterium]MBU1656345.1 EAL domain-containing protein [Gammaproteobacteria bacterium]MBU1959909.1 EAL domain-containing protein [Gammaproteobacteria bacterium]
MAKEFTEILPRAISAASHLVLITDATGQILYANEAVERASGYRSDELIGENCRIFKSGAHDALFYSQLWLSISMGKTYSALFVNKRKDGSTFYEDKSISPVFEDGRLTHFVSTGKVISGQSRDLEQLSDMISHDQMTGLFNRMHFYQRLRHALSQGKRRQDQLGVFSIDLDYFKKINDTLGHQVGDEVLMVVAQRMKACVREGDLCARLGGDEFAILLEDIGDVASLATIAKKIIHAISEPIEVKNHQLNVSCSIGIGIYPQDGKDADSLYRHADSAMYLAKSTGPGHFYFAQKKLTEESQLRLRLEQDIRYALERNELRIFYQPQVDLTNGRFVGAEALLRWEHPLLGLFSPDVLLPVLEEAGLIREVGAWVISQACEQIRIWEREGNDLEVSVNLSGHQLIQRNFVEQMALLMEQQCPTKLQLEISEALLIGDMVLAIDKLHGLERLGIKVCLDDFGTSRSSLAQLKRSHVKILKISKEFVRLIPGDEEAETIIESIIAIAHSMDMRVAAVGVENERQLDFLKDRGCDLVQGYMFSGPITGEEVSEMAREPNVLLKPVY